MEEIDLHEAHQSDFKRTASPSPSLIESPQCPKRKIKRKKHTLKKSTAAPRLGKAAARATTSTAAPPSTLATDSISLAELPVLFPQDNPAAESSGDSLDGVIF